MISRNSQKNMFYQQNVKNMSSPVNENKIKIYCCTFTGG